MDLKTHILGTMKGAIIDINVDCGESFGRYKLGNDEEVLKFVSSANVATGFHAGDPSVLWNTIKIAKKYNIAVGAHPGLQDIRGFGRRRILIDPDELKADILYQLGAIEGFLKVEGLKLQHVKPHGALYVMVEHDETYANAFMEAIELYNPELIVVVERETLFWKKARTKGLRVASEAFPDLAYDPQGKIIIEKAKKPWDPNLVLNRALKIIKEGKIDTIEGKEIEIKADTLCIHGDSPNAVEVAKTLREGLEKEGIKIAKLSEIIK